MKTIVVKTQAEFDALPERFGELTAVHIYVDPDKEISIKKTPGLAVVDVRGGTISDVSGGTISRAFGEAVVVCISDLPEILACHGAVIICQDCNPKIKTIGPVQIVRNSAVPHTIDTVCDIYPPDKKGFLTLYKSVHPDTLCDFYSGKIRYEGVVECPDWKPDPRIVCGNGLHLALTPDMALGYNPEGKVLECRVHKDDIAVYAKNITKVRCRRVEAPVTKKEKEKPKTKTRGETTT